LNGIAALHCEHYGRGANRTAPCFHQDVIMTALEDCFTTVETKMHESALTRARETRTIFQDWMRPRFRDRPEHNGSYGRAFFSQVRTTRTWLSSVPPRTGRTEHRWECKARGLSRSEEAVESLRAVRFEEGSDRPA
jgi:hypothetical protein